MKLQKQYCKRCLVKLDVSGDCPECGNRFDLSKSDSSISSQHVRRNYYVYVLMASILVGFTTYCVVFFLFSGDHLMKKMGSALFFIAPMSCGATFGFFFRSLGLFIVKLMYAIFMALALAGLIFKANILGLACGTILFIIFIAPLYIGILLGGLIRSWSIHVLTARFQSSPLLVFFLAPILYGAVEEQAFEPNPVRTVQTEVVIKAPQADVWNKLRFYEHVKQKPPLLLRIGMPIPKQAIGNHKQVGEITSCEYEGGGFIRKRITKLVEHQELGFDVIEQSIHFEHDLLLHGGSIRLRPINAGKYTVVTMSTHYESYVRPSWLWEPSMDYVVKTLHQFVIKDMQDDLNGDEDDHQIAHQKIQHMALMVS